MKKSLFIILSCRKESPIKYNSFEVLESFSKKKVKKSFRKDLYIL